MTTTQPSRVTHTELGLRALLVAALVLGVADVVALNVWAIPEVLEETSIQAVQSPPPLPAAALAPPPAALPAPPRAPTVSTSVAVRTVRRAPPAEACGSVVFAPGTWWVDRQNREALAAMLPRLAADPRMIQIIGHADARGSPALNQRISEERARAVIFLLVHAGIPERRMRARGVGTHGSEGGDLGRRVEIKLGDAP